jgi:hypothetical protein
MNNNPIIVKIYSQRVMGYRFGNTGSMTDIENFGIDQNGKRWKFQTSSYTDRTTHIITRDIPSSFVEVEE